MKVMPHLRALGRIAVTAAVASLLGTSPLLAQGTLLQGGPTAPGRVPMYVGQGSGQAVVQDSGPAGGGAAGLGLSELLMAKRGTGTPPYANGGTGPLGTTHCMYDAPTTNATGYHYLCLDPNAQGGGLIAYGTGGAASALPLQFIINGVTFGFSGGSGGDITASRFIGTNAAGGSNAAFLATSTAPGYAWQLQGAGVDQKVWDIIATGATYQFRAVNDADSAAHAWMTVTRGTGPAVSSIALADPVIVNSSLTVLPTPGSLTTGVIVQQTPTGTTTPGFNALNYINVASDTVNNGDGNEYTAFSVVHQTGGATVLGQRSALHVAQILTAATNPAGTQKDIVGATLQVVGQVGNAGGNFVATNPVAILESTASGAGGLTGLEIDIAAKAGSSSVLKCGVCVIQLNTDAVQGSSIDAGLLFANNGSAGWKQGVAFGAGSVSSGGVVIDMSTLTPGGPAFLLKGPSLNSYVDGSGNIGGTTLTLTGTAPSIIMATGAPAVLSMGSTNTGFENLIAARNAGTLANAGTVVAFAAQLTAGADAQLQMIASGGASPSGLIVAGTGLTGGLQIAANGGTLLLTSPTATNAIITGSFTATGLLHVADLATASQSTTVNGQTCTLAGICTVTGAPSGTAGGELAGTYPNPTMLGASVIAKLLAGFTSGAGVVSAADSILTAFQKVNGNVALRLQLAGGTMTGAIAMGGNDITGGGNIVGNTLQTGAPIVSGLPTCNSGAKATRSFVTDSNAASFTAGIGAVVATGGSTNVPVTCDGTNWRIGANDNLPLPTRKYA